MKDPRLDNVMNVQPPDDDDQPGRGLWPLVGKKPEGFRLQDRY